MVIVGYRAALRPVSYFAAVIANALAAGEKREPTPEIIITNRLNLVALGV